MACCIGPRDHARMARGANERTNGTVTVSTRATRNQPCHSRFLFLRIHKLASAALREASEKRRERIRFGKEYPVHPIEGEESKRSKPCTHEGRGEKIRKIKSGLLRIRLDWRAARQLGSLKGLLLLPCIHVHDMYVLRT